MSNTPKESKRSTKEKAAAARAAAEAEQKRRDRRVRLIGGAAILVAVALIIGLGVYGSKQNSTAAGGAGVVADAKVPTGVNGNTEANAWGVPYNSVSGKPTLAIWEDFQCPSCAEFEKNYGAAVTKMADDGKVNLVWRSTTFLDSRFVATSPNPNSSLKAAMAWGCAIDAGKKKEFHSTVFANQPATEGDGYTDAQITAFAKTAGITGDALTTFNSCVTAKTYNQWVTNSATAFKDSAVPGTPTAYLNGTEVPSATLQDMAALEKHRLDARVVTNLLASIPSPSQGVWNLGPLPVRAYALCILAGIFVAIWIGGRRWVARGGAPGIVADVAVWAVPFGIVGGRLYHVITDWQLYFGATGSGWVNALRIWDGGLGIWGAVVLGGVGAWIGVRRKGIPLPPFADAIAPGIAVAQAMGRFGNWFNQELFGRPTDLPWGLEIDPAHRPPGYEQFATYHPTFLYEALWCLAVAGIVVWADRRFTMGHARVFALYVGLYAVGRGLIESLRIDEAHHFFGIRLNVFTAIVVALGALVYLVVSARLRPGREAPELLDPTHASLPADEESTSTDLPDAGTDAAAAVDPPAADEDVSGDGEPAPGGSVVP